MMNCNTLTYICKAFAKTCKVLDLKQTRTKQYTPHTNGKAERFIQTLYKEWTYAMAFQNSEERNRWLPHYLSIYSRLRPHLVIGYRSPQQRLGELIT